MAESLPRFLAWDIEIARDVPDGADWRSVGPLGITCAGFKGSDWFRPHAFCRRDPSGEYRVLTRADCSAMVDRLMDFATRGYTITTWNGLSFDFDVLAQESGRFDDCRELALGHVDLMFMIFALKGFPLGLDKVCKGMGLPGKPEGINGAKAPRLWAEGEQRTVIDYVKSDVENLDRLHKLAVRVGGIQWITRTGKRSQMRIPEWLPVQSALLLPIPDNSWMAEPWERSKFTGWLDAEGVK